MTLSDDKIEHQLMMELASLRNWIAEMEASAQLDGLANEPTETHSFSLGAADKSATIEQTIEAVAEGIVVTDDRGRILHLNSRAESLFVVRRRN